MSLRAGSRNKKEHDAYAVDLVEAVHVQLPYEAGELQGR